MVLRSFVIGVLLWAFLPTYFVHSKVESTAMTVAKKEEKLAAYMRMVYDQLEVLNDKPDFLVFQKALSGFLQLSHADQIENKLLTIIDFSLPSTQERLWIIDMTSQAIIYQSYVAHGQQSGGLYAEHFSNKPNSHQSSLGFYITGEPYHGKHGLSLRLDGLEAGINDKARERAIVIHSADYVSQTFIEQHGRLGRSHGCPAIPKEAHEKIIQQIAGKSCLYIYHDSPAYHAQSQVQLSSQVLNAMIIELIPTTDLSNQLN